MTTVCLTGAVMFSRGWTAMTAVSLVDNKGLIRQMAERGVDIFVYIYSEFGTAAPDAPPGDTVLAPGRSPTAPLRPADIE